MGRLLMALGVVIFIVGLAYTFGVRWPKIPGDIHIERDGVQIHFPIVSCLLISLFISGVMWILRKIS